jgi:succinate-acetate transporter protein
MFDYIPVWIVALSALITTVLILTHDQRKQIPIRIFALSSGVQLIIYTLFTFCVISPEIKQSIARVSTITMNLSLSIILLSVRIKHGK